jgi:hypothetical protein
MAKNKKRLDIKTIKFLNSPEYLKTLLPRNLDTGIRREVEILFSNGVETFESCEGGKGHSFPEPTIRFHGNSAAGWKALQVAFDHALPVSALRREWCIIDGEPTGPTWAMTFFRRKAL